MDPDLIMSSHQDLSFTRIPPPPMSMSSRLVSSGPLTNDQFQPSEALLATLDTSESPRIPLPDSITAMLRQYLSARPSELG
jgi:hypothetical protein